MTIRNTLPAGPLARVRSGCARALRAAADRLDPRQSPLSVDVSADGLPPQLSQLRQHWLSEFREMRRISSSRPEAATESRS